MDAQVQESVEKAKSAGCVVMSAKVNDMEFVYRSINRMEWRSLQQSLQSKIDNQSPGAKEDGEDELVMKALISPKIVDKAQIASYPAGVITQLAEYILQASGFGIMDSEPVKL